MRRMLVATCLVGIVLFLVPAAVRAQRSARFCAAEAGEGHYPPGCPRARPSTPSQATPPAPRQFSRPHPSPPHSQPHRRSGPTVADVEGHFDQVPIRLYQGDSQQPLDRVGPLITATLRATHFARNPILASDSAGQFWYGLDVVSALDNNTKEFGYLVYTVSWNGAIWSFSNIDHMNTFISNPRRYLPQYGGHCAECMVQGDLQVPSDSFRVRNGRLYLFTSDGLARQWESHSTGVIESADARWRRTPISQLHPAGSNNITPYLSY
jgi:hypothetical protein